MLLLFQYSNFDNFINSYSSSVREIFNFTHSLTFASLVGNGINVASNYQRLKLNTNEFLNDKNTYILRRSMIFSTVILSLFIIAFAMELSIVHYIPKIFYQKFSTSPIIVESEFTIFSLLYLICNIITIICFVMNIFNVNITEEIIDEEVIIQTYDMEETRDNSIA